MPNCSGAGKGSCLNKLSGGELPRFVRYAQKMFHLQFLAGACTDSRPFPEIPARAVALTLLLGEVVQIPSQLQLQAETGLWQWQQWVGYPDSISDDTLNYVSERMDPEQWRRGLVWINRKLKRGKAFEESKVHGLLTVSLDANEQFCSDQERYDIYQETLALTQGQPPQETVERDGRKVEIWDVPQMTFSDSYTEPVRVVRARETYLQRQRIGGKWVTQEKEQNWIWVVAGNLDGYDGASLRDWGHLRWKIENNAFNELTQSWHLTHCAHHHPVALQVLLWAKIMAFTLFHAFVILHGKLLRLGKVTLQELRKRLYRSLLCEDVAPFFSG